MRINEFLCVAPLKCRCHEQGSARRMDFRQARGLGIVALRTPTGAGPTRLKELNDRSEMGSFMFSGFRNGIACVRFRPAMPELCLANFVVSNICQHSSPPSDKAHSPALILARLAHVWLQASHFHTNVASSDFRRSYRTFEFAAMPPGGEQASHL